MRLRDYEVAISKSEPSPSSILDRESKYLDLNKAVSGIRLCIPTHVCIDKLGPACIT